jgi:hypothetical protein
MIFDFGLPLLKCKKKNQIIIFFEIDSLVVFLVKNLFKKKCSCIDGEHYMFLSSFLVEKFKNKVHFSDKNSKKS